MNTNVIETTSHAPSRTDTRVFSQWCNRPDDQRFTDLNSMYNACLASAESAETRIVDSKRIAVSVSEAEPDSLKLIIPGERQGQDGVLCNPSHWSFGQACGLVNAPATYLRRLRLDIAAINLQHGLMEHRAEKAKAYITENGNIQLRALTGPDYGRIYDHEVVNAIRNIAGNGVDETCWRVPGVYGKALQQVTKENTTLYASDRDVFIFLVDEQRPIEIGKLDNGDPDIVYRGFYVWNSEVGARSFGIATFLYRTVCANRIIWGQRDFQEIRYRHSSNAPSRFMYSTAPALDRYANASIDNLVTGIQDAKKAIVAKNDDARTDYLTRNGFTKAQTKKIIDTVFKEEGHAARSIWDFVQGITAVARDIKHQDARIQMESKATKLLKKVA